MSITYAKPKYKDYSPPEDLRDRNPRQNKALEFVAGERMRLEEYEQIIYHAHHHDRLRYYSRQSSVELIFSTILETTNVAERDLIIALLTKLHSREGDKAASKETKEELSLDIETRAWLNSDLSIMEELEPYDWGDSDPETIGESIDW